MLARFLGRMAVAVALAVSCSSIALACSCGNATPVQRTLEKYNNRAVFTAHVIQLIGKVDNRDGKRYSHLALAVVHERFWGLPWYWPTIVILDGGFFCDMELAEGEDYFVSGYRDRYGVLDVSHCSRTHPLRWSQVDLRTLDGSHCSAPGGTIIGMLYARPVGRDFRPKSEPGATLTVTNAAGERYSGTSDVKGIFEISHIPAGEYAIEPELQGNKFTYGGVVHVTAGACVDASRSVSSYVVTGHISGLKAVSAWGWRENANVELVPANEKDARLLAAGNTPLDRYDRSVGPEDRFYFDDIPPGEYLLGVNIWDAPSAGSPFAPTYYPGTGDRNKAARIHVGQERVPGLFDFVPSRVALANVPIVVTFGDGTPVPEWGATMEVAWPGQIRWVGIDYVGNREGRSLIGVVGRRHRIHVQEGVKYDKEAGTERCSGPIEVEVRPGIAAVRVALTHGCGQW